LITPDDVGWHACLEDLADVATRLGDRVRATGDTESDADLAVKMFGAVMGAYLTHLWAEPEHPSFLPSVGYHQMYGWPNPDTVYRNAAVDGAGDYRLRGHRGTVPDVTIMPFGGPTATGLQTFPPFDFDDLVIDDDGTFEVVLSRERPAGNGNWWPLDPEMRTLMLRSVSEEWGADVEPRVAIVRLDTDARRGRVDPDSLRRRFRSYAAVVEGMVASGLARVAQLRSDGVVNQLVTVDYSANGGLDDQWYQEGCFELADDEALVLEARLPPDLRARSLSLTDRFFSTIDWANAQSSLNRHQAVTDGDDVLRVVVATHDPGVHNWLDTTGHNSGSLQCRWSGGRACPEVAVERVQASALDQLLPFRTARVTPEQRAATIRARQVGVQLRSRW
jgi:hypothetical protein